MAVTAAENREFPAEGESELSDFEDEPMLQSSSEKSHNNSLINESVVEDVSMAEINYEQPIADRSRSDRENSNDRNESPEAEKIRQIDQEMKIKLLELHELMKAEGMDESVEVIERCKELIKRKQTKGKENNLNVNTNVVAGKRGNKASCNNNTTPNVLMGSGSVETIYESAVPKRNSSSSEDELNFDQTLGNKDNVNEQINVLISERRRSLSQDRTEQRHDNFGEGEMETDPRG